VAAEINPRGVGDPKKKIRVAAEIVKSAWRRRSKKKICVAAEITGSYLT